MINETVLRKLIRKHKLVRIEDLQSATKVAEHLECSVIDVLIGRDLLKEKDLGKLLSENYKVGYVDLDKGNIDVSVLKLIPEDFAQSYGVIAFDRKDGKLFVAMEDPSDLE